MASTPSTRPHERLRVSRGSRGRVATCRSLTGVDTRALTKGLRERGSILGRLEVEGAPPSPPAEVGFVDPNLRNLVAEVSTKSIRTYNEGSDKPTIVAIDCGMKHNIVRYFVETHDVTLIVVPFDYDLEKNPFVSASCGAFTPSTRLVAIRRGRGCFLC